MRHRKEHVVNFGSFFVNRVFSLGLFAVTTSIFINRAGNEKFGILTMLLLIFNYISIVDLGMGQAIGYRLTRAVSRHKQHSAVKILQHALPFYVVIGLVSSLAVFVFARDLSVIFTKSEAYTTIYRMIALSITPLLLDAVVLMILQAHNKVYLINASRLLYDIFRALPLLLVLVVNNDLFRYIMALIVVGCYFKLFVDIYLGYRVMGTIRWIRPVYLRKELIFNIRFGLPMLATLLIGMIISSVDKFYITNFISLEQLAYYSVALEVNVKAWFLVWAVTGSLQTVLVRRNVTGRDTLDLEKISLLSVAIIFACYYLPLLLFARQILTLWINADFAGNSYRICQVLTVYSLLYMLYAVKHNLLQAMGRFGTISLIYLLGLIVLLLGLVILPRHLNLIGVALSYVLSYSAFVVAAFASFRKVAVKHA